MRALVTDAADMNTVRGSEGTVLEGPFLQMRQSMEKMLISCFGPCPTAQLRLSSAPSLIPRPALGTPQELMPLPWSGNRATLEEEHIDSSD